MSFNTDFLKSQTSVGMGNIQGLGSSALQNAAMTMPSAPTSEIQRQVHDMENSVTTLQSVLVDLGGKLNPVMAPDISQPRSGDNQANPIASELGNALYAQTRRIVDLIEFVRLINERLCL